MQDFDLKTLAIDWDKMINELIDTKKTNPLVPYQPSRAYQTVSVKHKPKISICVPTMRVGGLDVLFAGLQQQTFQDFEVVIADSLYKYRKDIVAERIKSYSFAVKHVDLKYNQFPISQNSHGNNSAIIHAAADTILFITDYTFLNPQCVEKHVQFSQYNTRLFGQMAPHQYCGLPPVKAEFPKYSNPEWLRYRNDIHTGKLDNCMWSIFDQDFDGQLDQLPDDSMKDADRKLREPAGVADHQEFNGKNESLQTEMVLNINGWDEEFDGSHCNNDNEFSDHLVKKYGFTWILDPTNVAYIINPRSIFPTSNRLRPYTTNLPIWRRKQAEHYMQPKNLWNLTEEREKNI